MKITFRVTRELLRRIHQDLSRPHSRAAERVGFLTCGVAPMDNGLGIFASIYHPVDDDDYVDDPVAAAMIRGSAFRKILQYAYNYPSAVFHIHRHNHRGIPRPSRIDQRESANFVPNFWNVCPTHPHGILVLSFDSIVGQVWIPKSEVRPIDVCQVIGDERGWG